MAGGIDQERIQLDKSQLVVNQNQLSVLREIKENIKTETNKTINSFKTMFKSIDLSSLTSKLSNIFSGAFNKFTNSFKNLGRTLVRPFASIKNSFSNLKTSITKPFPSIKNITTGLVKKPINKVKQFFDQNKERAQTNFFKLWGNVKKIGKIFSKEFWSGNKNKKNDKTKTSSTDTILGGISGILTAISKGITMISTAIAWFFSGGGFGIGLAIGLTPPVLLICGTILLIFFMLVAFSKPLFDKIIQVLTMIIDDIAPDLIKLSHTIVNTVDSFFNLFNKLFSGLGKLMDDFFKDPVGFLKDFLPLLTSSISNIFKEGIGIILNNLPKLIETGTKVLLVLVKNLPAILEEIFTNLVPVLIKGFCDTIEMLLDRLPSILDKLSVVIDHLITDLIKNLTTLFNELPKLIKVFFTDFLPSIITGLATTLKVLFESLASIIVQLLSQDLPNIIEGAFQGILKVLIDLPKMLLETIKGIIPGGSELVTKAAGAAVGFVKGLFTSDKKENNNNKENPVDILVKNVNELLPKVNNTLTDILNKIINKTDFENIFKTYFDKLKSNEPKNKQGTSKIGNAYNSFKEKVSSALTSTDNNKDFIKSFNMNLVSFNTHLIDINNNIYKLNGELQNSINNGVKAIASEIKKLNNLNVTVSNPIDLKPITEAFETNNKLLTDIRYNTALTENGHVKEGLKDYGWTVSVDDSVYI